VKSQNIMGGGLMALALFTFLSGVGDRIKDLEDWHGLQRPAIVGVILKDASGMVLMGLGGLMTQVPRRGRRTREADSVGFRPPR
jgi:hypothetical protein